MLPRARRLAEKDVERLMKGGRPVTLGAFRMKYAPSSLPVSRFAFVVSKKVARTSVTRNRLRRWCALAAREHTPRVAVDAAISVTSRYETLDLLRKDMQALLAQIL